MNVPLLVGGGENDTLYINKIEFIVFQKRVTLKLLVL
jgi:hypothetical protein